MAILYTVDFKNRKLLSKKEIVDGEEMPDQTNLSKLSVFNEYIESGMTMVKVYTRSPGVSLPKSISEGNIVTSINWSYKFKVPDFSFDDKGVRGSLSFGGNIYFVDLPWSSIYAVYSHSKNETKEWKESLPKDIIFPE